MYRIASSEVLALLVALTQGEQIARVKLAWIKTIPMHADGQRAADSCTHLPLLKLAD